MICSTPNPIVHSQRPYPGHIKDNKPNAISIRPSQRTSLKVNVLPAQSANPKNRSKVEAIKLYSPRARAINAKMPPVIKGTETARSKERLAWFQMDCPTRRAFRRAIHQPVNNDAQSTTTAIHTSLARTGLLVAYSPGYAV